MARLLLAGVCLLPFQSRAQEISEAGMTNPALEISAPADSIPPANSPIMLEEPEDDPSSPRDEETAAEGSARPAARNGEAPEETAAVEEDEAGRSVRIPTASARENLPEVTVDNLRTNTIRDWDEAPGIRVGTFVLRPSITQGISYEKTTTGSSSQSRGFSQTDLRGTMTSDWSRHQLTVNAEGRYERNIWGEGETDPEFNVDADLRLDLAGETTVNLTAAYRFEREDSSDPNAVSGASSQADIHRMLLGARVERDFGLIRGRLGTEIEREIFGDVTFGDGTRLSLSDRNNTEARLIARVGYEISPALIPFLEASAGRSIYDEKHDSLGYERSAVNLGARTGVELDLGEKLRGELAFGYTRSSFDDDRLKALDALSVDGSATWSPRRGTDVALNLRTAIEPSTDPGLSGYVAYSADALITHELREKLVARLTGGYTWRDFPSSYGADQNVYLAGAGLTYDINRYLALTGNVSYELTTQDTGPDTKVTRAGLGLTLRR
ncbi:MAG: outer membrane beta-barrel protein [Shinella sp.]|nr:outer membrane beta-barrel protein [Shinella sp.]